MLNFYCRAFAILVVSFSFSTVLLAIGPEIPAEENVPPPSGPYQLDPAPMSATIYEQGEKEALLYPQQTGGYRADNGPQNYREPEQYQYEQPYASPQGYYPQQGGAYGYGSQPVYQGYQPGYHPGQGYPPGQSYNAGQGYNPAQGNYGNPKQGYPGQGYPGQGNYGYPNR